MKRSIWLNLLCIVLLALQFTSVVGVSAQAPTHLRLATTTSTYDSGLLDYILPDFEKANNVKVDVVAVGTGQALEIGSKGDADVVLVHQRSGEDKFVKDGNAKARFDVMYNDFIVVGPAADPVKASAQKSAAGVFAAVAAAQANFASRGDKSGTNSKEMTIWASAGITPTAEMKWYKSLGQGMGETLLFSEENGAYTLTDRGTYLAMKDKLPDIAVVFGGQNISENKDSSLLNPYGVLVVNPDKHPGVNSELATQFQTWLLSAETQKLIGGYGVEKFGQPLFYPNSDDYKASREVTVKIGDKSQTFTLADLQAMPKQTLADYEAIGHKKGPLGKNTWTGVSLKDLLLKVDPAIGDPANAGKLVVATATDGWKSTVRWDELFGTWSGGERLADIYGCTECHGINGEGTAPAGKPATSALAGRNLSIELSMLVLRTGKPLHGQINAFTPEQITDAEIVAIMDWFKNPQSTASDFQPDPAKRMVLLCYEMNGKPMTGADGLIQMIDGMDKYSSRYAHWVQTVEVN